LWQWRLEATRLFSMLQRRLPDYSQCLPFLAIASVWQLFHLYNYIAAARGPFLFHGSFKKGEHIVLWIHIILLRMIKFSYQWGNLIPCSIVVIPVINISMHTKKYHLEIRSIPYSEINLLITLVIFWWLRIWWVKLNTGKCFEEVSGSHIINNTHVSYWSNIIFSNWCSLWG